MIEKTIGPIFCAKFCEVQSGGSPRGAKHLKIDY